jgi:hypothetical protein
MSSKISEMPVVLTPVGTEVVPAVTLAGNHIKIPINSINQHLSWRNLITENEALLSTDAGKALSFDLPGVATATFSTLIVGTDAEMPMAIGSVVMLFVENAAQLRALAPVVITGQSGVVIKNGKSYNSGLGGVHSLRNKWSMAKLTKQAANTWVLDGDLTEPVSTLNAAREPYILLLTQDADFVNNTYSEWTGVETPYLAPAPLCTWDGYYNMITFLVPGVYEIKLITRLDCYDATGGQVGGSAPWPRVGAGQGAGAVGVGLENVLSVGHTAGMPQMQQSVHCTNTGLQEGVAPTHFQWTDSFIVDSTSGGQPNTATPFIEMYGPANNEEYQALKVKMILVATLIVPFDIMPDPYGYGYGNSN